MELEGTIKIVFDEQKFDSGFYKKEFVLTTEEQYPQEIKFELLKDKTELVRDAKPGDRFKVYFDIRGREWNGNYYNNLVVWKMETAGASAPAPAPTDSPFDADLSALNSDDDDLPF